MWSSLVCVLFRSFHNTLRYRFNNQNIMNMFMFMHCTWTFWIFTTIEFTYPSNIWQTEKERKYTNVCHQDLLTVEVELSKEWEPVLEGSYNDFNHSKLLEEKHIKTHDTFELFVAIRSAIGCDYIKHSFGL